MSVSHCLPRLTLAGILASSLASQAQFDELRMRHIPDDRLGALGGAAGDINGDGLVDIVLTESLGRLRTYHGQGDRLVPSINAAPNLFGGRGVALADTDRDGDLDIYVARSNLIGTEDALLINDCLLYTSPSPRDPE